MVRGEGGNLYDAFRERCVAVVGWTGQTCQAWRRTYAVDRSLPVRRTQAKQGTVISGASQVWRFVNDIQDGDCVVTYSPANRLYSIGKITGPAEAHPEWDEQDMPLVRKVQWQEQDLPRDNLRTHPKIRRH